MFKFTKHYPLLLLLITFSGTPNNGFAADNDSTDNNRGLSLRIGHGVGYAVFQDRGTAPFNYNGICITPLIGLHFNNNSWNFSFDALTSAGVFSQSVNQHSEIDAYEINNTFRFKIYHEIFDMFSLGIAASNFFNVTINPNYENSAAGISEFIGPEIVCRADIPMNRLFQHHYWNNKKIHFEMLSMPFAAVMRPGYAYIDNYTATQPVSNAIFSDYLWHFQPFASLCTNIGLDITTRGKAHISLSYLWSFHTSETLSSFADDYNGSSSFHHASHILLIDFLIPLK